MSIRVAGQGWRNLPGARAVSLLCAGALSASVIASGGLVLSQGTAAASTPPTPTAQLVAGNQAAESATTLDPTGATIPLPATPYLVPTGTVYMAPTTGAPAGKDSNAGTSASTPVLTLAHAISLLPTTGGTLVAAGGIYHDGDAVVDGNWTTETKKSFTFEAAPGAQPLFDGSVPEPSTSWKPQTVTLGNGKTMQAYSMSWVTSDFCENADNPIGGYYNQTMPWLGTAATTGPCDHWDMVGDPTNPASADPQMVFNNGAYVTEVTTSISPTTGQPTGQPATAPSGNAFWYDFTNHVIYTNFAPTSTEVTKYPNALVVENSKGVTIRGIGFERYASNEKNEGSLTHGAVAVEGGSNVTFQNDVFAWNAGAALTFLGAPSNVTVDHDVFANNGFNGVDGDGQVDTPSNFTIENSVFNQNNNEYFGLGCTQSCATAASKLAHMDDFTIENNIIENEHGNGSGFWCDLHCENGTIIGNVVANNGDVGIFYEVSDLGTIASNLVYGNGEYREPTHPDGTGDGKGVDSPMSGDDSDKGAGIRVSSAHTTVANNTLYANSSDIVVYDDARSPNDTNGPGPGAVGPDTTNVTVENNILDQVAPVETATKAAGDSWLYGAFERPDTTAGALQPNGPGPSQFFASPGASDYNAYYRPTSSSPTRLYWWDNNGSNSNTASLPGGADTNGVDFDSAQALTGTFTTEEKHSQDLVGGVSGVSGSTDPFFPTLSKNFSSTFPTSTLPVTPEPDPDPTVAFCVQPGSPALTGGTVMPNVPVASGTPTQNVKTVIEGAGDTTSSVGTNVMGAVGWLGQSCDVPAAVIAAPPTASAPCTLMSLTCTFDATASTSGVSEGQISSYAWDFGDNTTAGTGVKPTHTYAKPGTYTVTLTVTDSYGAVSNQVAQVTVNAPPVARITTPVCPNLSCPFDGSTSTDTSPGTVISYAWTFGDGQSTSGPTATASHTYLAAGTYPVTLTVTDNQGAQNTATTSVTVSPPANPTNVPYGTDNFGRTVSGGFGTATSGQAWTLATGSSSNLSVASGVGSMNMPTAGAQVGAELKAISQSDTDTRVSLASNKIGSGTGIFVHVVGRRVVTGSPAVTNEYDTRVKIVGSTVYAAISKIVGSTETFLIPDTTVSGITYTPNMMLDVRFQVSGTNPTTLRVKVWPSTSTEPTTWMLSTTDATTAALQAPGDVGLTTYLSSSATNAPVLLSVSNYSVDPTSAAPVAMFTPTCSGLTCNVNASASSDQNPNGSISQYQWSWDDGTPVTTGITTAHTFAAAGTYPVTLTVTNAIGWTNVLTSSVTVPQA